MKKMYNDLVDLLPDLISSFTNHTLFDVLEEDDLISFVPITDAAVGQEMVDQTNTVLAAFLRLTPPKSNAMKRAHITTKKITLFFFGKITSVAFTTLNWSKNS